MRRDLTGQRFGKLVAIEPTDKRKNQLVVWRCQCDCGNTCEVVGSQLTKGATRSCGCLKSDSKINDITGERFGRLVVLEPTAKRVRGSVVWKCQCDCGNTCEVPTSLLRSGQVQSCGCLRVEANCKDLSGQRFGRLTAIKPIGRKNRYVLWQCQCDCGNTAEVTTNKLTSGKVRSCGCLRGAGNAQSHTADDKAVALAMDAAVVRAPSLGRATSKTSKSASSRDSRYPRNLAGRHFGKLTAIEPTDARDHGSVVWRCVCECGSFRDVPRRTLVSGTTQSCGCCKGGF